MKHIEYILNSDAPLYINDVGINTIEYPNFSNFYMINCATKRLYELNSISKQSVKRHSFDYSLRLNEKLSPQVRTRLIYDYAQLIKLASERIFDWLQQTSLEQQMAALITPKKTSPVTFESITKVLFKSFLPSSESLIFNTSPLMVRLACLPLISKMLDTSHFHPEIHKISFFIERYLIKRFTIYDIFRDPKCS